MRKRQLVFVGQVLPIARQSESKSLKLRRPRGDLGFLAARTSNVAGVLNNVIQRDKVPGQPKSRTRCPEPVEELSTLSRRGLSD